MSDRRYSVTELKVELRALGIRDTGLDGTSTGLAQRIARYRAKGLLDEGDATPEVKRVGRRGHSYSIETLRRLAYIVERRNLQPRLSDQALLAEIMDGKHDAILGAAPIAGGHLHFFLLCSGERADAIARVLREPLVTGAYQVCGDHPWLLVVRADHPRQLHELATARLNVVSVLHTASGADTYLFPADVSSSRERGWRAFVEVRFGDTGMPQPTAAASALPGTGLGPAYRPFLEWLWSEHSATERGEMFVPLAAHRLVGAASLLLEVLCTDAQALFHLIRLCAEHGLATSTKCVLATWKQAGVIVREPAQPLAGTGVLESPARGNYDYALQLALHNHGERLLAPHEKQHEFFNHVVKRAAERDYPCRIPEVVRELGDWLPQSEGSRSGFMADVDRIQLAVQARGWVRVFLLVKSKLGKLPALEEELRSFLGVTRNYCALKLMRCTGRYDFIVPIDCADEQKTISDIVKQWWEAFGAYIDDEIRHIVVRPLFREHEDWVTPGDTSLSGVALALIQRFTSLDCSLDQFQRDVEELHDFLTTPDGVPTNPWLLALYEDYRGELATTGRPVTSAQIAETLRSQLPPWTRRSDAGTAAGLFEALGLRPQIEFGRTIHHAFVRLQLRAPNNKPILAELLRSRLYNDVLAAEVYEPVRSPTELLLSIRFRAFEELERFVREVQQDHCRRVSFAIVFSQCYYAPLPHSARSAQRRCHPH